MPSQRLPLFFPTDSTAVAFPDGSGNGYFNTKLQTPFVACYIYRFDTGGSSGLPDPTNGASPPAGAPGIPQSPITLQVTPKPQLLAGVQSWRPTEGSAPQLQYETGNDWFDFIMQPRPFEVTFTRTIPRGKDIRAIMRNLYTTVSDIDFRVLPVALQVAYQQKDPTGTNTAYDATWTWAVGILGPVVGPYWNGAYSAMMEDITFTGRGIAYTDQSGLFYNNSEKYWGTAPNTGGSS